LTSPRLAPRGAGATDGVEAAYLSATEVGGDFFQALTLEDGSTLVANARGELFGFERMQPVSTRPARDIAEAACEWGQNDDITVLTVRRSLA
jgi:serine phosphatase RsbU (regulator of sigma subunit)